MKSIQMIISSLVLILGLSGCASTAYQRSYVGYGATYGESGYYDVPEESYYQPTPVIYYEQTYIPSHRSHHHDDHHHGRKADRDGHQSQGRHEGRASFGSRSRHDFYDNSTWKNESGRRGNGNEHRQGNRQPRNQEQENAVARVSRQAFDSAPRSHRGDEGRESNLSEPKAGNERRRHERH